MSTGSNQGGWGGWILFAVIVIGVGYLYQREGGNLFDTNSGPFGVFVDKPAIQRVLDRDKELAEWAKREVDRGCNRVEVLQLLVKQMKEIDLKKCPQDLQAAYLKHIDAWQALIPLAAKYDGLLGFLTAAAEGYAGKYDGEREYKEVTQKITATWTEVKRITLAHGVQAK